MDDLTWVDKIVEQTVMPEFLIRQYREETTAEEKAAH